MAERWWINGEEGRLLDISERGLTYADGLFETIAVQAGQPRFLDYHLDRLLAGCQRLLIPAPDRSGLGDELSQHAAAAGEAVLKLVLSRGPGGRGYVPPRTPSVTRIIGLLARAPAPARHYSEGIVAGFVGMPVSENRQLAGLKTLARLEQVLAAAEREAMNLDEALMCDQAGQLVCGTMSNVFLVHEGELHTPDLSGAGVRGVMRRVILEEASRLGITVREQPVPLKALGDATEVFVSNALIGLWPVRRLGERELLPGPLSRRLQEALVQRGVHECSAGC